MKNFRINYSFQGKGSVIVKAKNKEEAEQIFLLEYNNVKLKNIDFEVVVTE